jgi:hypothetical protein
MELLANAKISGGKRSSNLCGKKVCLPLEVMNLLKQASNTPKWLIFWQAIKQASSTSREIQHVMVHAPTASVLLISEPVH